MGGDRAPGEIIKGAIGAAVAAAEVELLLVGDPAKIASELSRYRYPAKRVTVIPAGEVIGADEAPVGAVRRKKDASLNIAINQVKEGRADAVLSAGNTGAFMAAALFGLKRLPGIDRPALCMALPTRVAGQMVVLLDLGANVTATATNLAQFAVMGAIYAGKILGVIAPRVGLLNVGTEEIKGNSHIQEAYTNLKAGSLNFIGNVEARDIFDGGVDVVVCDGFAGNAVLKSSEGLAQAIFAIIREEIGSSWRFKLGALLLRPALRTVRSRLDYTEYGGAPFLGVNGICIKCHGNSDAKAFQTAVLASLRFVENNILQEIENNTLQQEG